MRTQAVDDSKGNTHTYDRLLLATGGGPAACRSEVT